MPLRKRTNDMKRTLKQVAAVAGCSDSAVRKLIIDGHLKGEHNGPKSPWVVTSSVEDIKAAVNAHLPRHGWKKSITVSTPAAPREPVVKDQTFVNVRFVDLPTGTQIKALHARLEEQNMVIIQLLEQLVSIWSK